MEVGRVNVKITADNSDANSKFKETKQNLSDIKTPLAGIETMMKSAFAVAAVAAFTTAVKDSLNVMAQYETAMKGLQKTSEGYGQSALKAMQYAQRLSEDGLITVIDSATTLKNLMGSGFNIEEAFNLATAMKDIGAFNNTVGNIGQAMQDASKGIKTNSIELIENIGLTQRLSGVMDKAGISIANGIDLSNSAAQRQALLNSILAEGTRNYGNAAEYANTYAGSVAKMQKSFKDLQNEMATVINGPAGKLFEMLASGMKEITIVVKQYTETKKSEEKAKNLMLPTTSIFTMPTEELKKSTDALQAQFDKVRETYMNDAFGTKEQYLYWEKVVKVIQRANEELEKRSNKLKEQKKIESLSTSKDIIAKDEEQRYFSELETEIKNVEIVGKVLDKTIDEINQSKLSVISGEIEALGKAGDTTSDKFKKLRAMWNALVKEMNNSKIAVRIDSSAQYIHPASNVYNAIPNDYTPDEYNPYQNVDFSDIKLSGAGSSGVNMGAYYGGLGYNGMISNVKNTRKSISTGEGSGAVYNEKQSEYYKKLYSDMADELNKATESVGSAFSDLGNKLNNDFLKSLGDTVRGIADLQQSLEAMKNAKSIGGTAGALGTLSAGLGIAGAVIGIGSTIYNAIKPAGNKQMSAAEKMSDAVQKFKDSLKDSTVQEISTKGKGLSLSLVDTNAEIEKKKAKINKIALNPATQPGDVGIAFLRNEIKILENARETSKRELEAIKPEIIDKLNIVWTDLAGSVRGAFDASNLTDFYSQFKSNLQSNIKDALVSAFLQSDAMKNAMSGLTDSIYNELFKVDLDASKINPETMNGWNTTIDDLSKQGGAFFEVLQKLGLAGTSAADALDSTSNSMKNMPEGIKVASYRFAALAALDASKPKAAVTEKVTPAKVTSWSHWKHTDNRMASISIDTTEAQSSLTSFSDSLMNVSDNMQNAFNVDKRAAVAPTIAKVAPAIDKVTRSTQVDNTTKVSNLTETDNVSKVSNLTETSNTTKNNDNIKKVELYFVDTANKVKNAFDSMTNINDQTAKHISVLHTDMLSANNDSFTADIFAKISSLTNKSDFGTVKTAASIPTINKTSISNTTTIPQNNVFHISGTQLTTTQMKMAVLEALDSVQGARVG